MSRRRPRRRAARRERVAGPERAARRERAARPERAAGRQRGPDPRASGTRSGGAPDARSGGFASTLGGQLVILAVVFAVAVLVAELAGAANLGVAFGVGQIAFTVALVYLLLKR